MSLSSVACWDYLKRYHVSGHKLRLILVVLMLRHLSPSLNIYINSLRYWHLKVIQALPSMPKPVTESEVNNLLQSKLNIQIATVDEEGYPIIHPTWFLYENDSGKLFTGTAKMTRKVQNIQSNPDRIYFFYWWRELSIQRSKGKGSCKNIRRCTEKPVNHRKNKLEVSRYPWAPSCQETNGEH